MTVAQATVRTARMSETTACIETLTRAFESNPVCNWAWSDRARYREAFPRFCKAFGGAAFESETAHIEGACTGVALWLEPGAQPDAQAVVELIVETAPKQVQEPLFSIFEQMDAYHPREPHWHLPLIGVHPSAQGRGIGSALLRHQLRRCDEQQTTAYLEATSPANVRLYERHGFVEMGRIEAGGSPPITPMVRVPMSQLPFTSASRT